MSVERSQARTTGLRAGRARLIVALAIAAVAGIVTWLIVRGGDDGQTVTGGAGARIVSTQALAAFAGGTGFPVFWAGERPGARPELTSTPNGRVYVRYLPPGVKAGDSRAQFLSVATYSVSRGFSALVAESRRPGAESFRLPGDGIAMYNKGRPASVYVAYRTLPVQVEVFDPSPAQARALVRAGAVRPVGASGTGAVPVGPSLMTAGELRRFARANGGPVYWAGEQRGRSYELTRTIDGRVYVRYVPPGVRAGDPAKRFLTVGTYPVRDGVETLRGAATAQRLSRLWLPGGALAVFNARNGKNVYYATRGSPAEVEAYSPSAGRALQLVAGGRVVPVG
jgi:hypothetical protein